MKSVLFILIIFWIYVSPVNAFDVHEKISEETGINELRNSLPQDIQDMLSEYELSSGEGGMEVISKMKEKAKAAIVRELESVWQPALRVLVITILSALFLSVLPSDRLDFPITLAGGSGIVYLTISNTQSFMNECLSAILEMYDFSTVLLPCLAGVSVFAGASVSAGVKYTAAALFMNILLQFCNTFLIPLICIYLVCVIGNVLFEQKVLGAISDWIKRLSKSLLTGTVVIFTAYLNIAGLIASSGDAFGTRLTKTALSAGLPVVGRIMSDAASTLVAGASMIRNCVGAFGLLAVIGIILGPFVAMGVRYLLFKLVGEVSVLFPNHKLSPLIQGIAGAFGMMLAVLGTGFLMIFLTLVSFMQVMSA